MTEAEKRQALRRLKRDLRDRYKAERRAIAPEERAARDAQICNRFLSSITYRYARVFLLYAPLWDEIDCMPIAERAMADGKTVAFPRCLPDCRMRFHVVKDLSALIPCAYGIREPREDAPVYIPEAAGAEQPVCVVPGVVFDEEGYRIGYGKGYYDRYLSSFPGVRVALCYSDLVIPRVPRGRYDLPVDIQVTEKGVRAVHAT